MKSSIAGPRHEMSLRLWDASLDWPKGAHVHRPGLLGLYVADVLATVIALLLADHARFTWGLGAEIGPLETFIATPLLVLVAVVWSITAIYMGLYDRPRVWSWFASLRSAAVAVIVADSIFAATLYLSFRDVSRLLFLYFAVGHIVCLFIVRAILAAFERGLGTPFLGTNRVVLIGSGEYADEVVGLLDRLDDTIRVVGRIPSPQTNADPGSDEETFIQRAVAGVESTNADEVVVADPELSRASLLGLVFELRTLPARVTLVPDLRELITSRASFEEMDGLPLIGLHGPAITGTRWVVKRMFDLLVAPGILLLLTPLFFGITLAIWLESGRPIFFRQRRIGLGGVPFDMLKFRTMDHDAPSKTEGIHYRDENGKLVHKQPGDPRVTKTGALLRRFGIDELPQLLHVCSGTMSLVGPRPELPEIVREYEPWQFRRFAVAPGITGWWQVHREHTVPMHFQTELDIYYILNHSFALDLQILLKTVSVLVSGRGAY